MRVFVKDNNVDQALRFLKKMQREGLLPMPKPKVRASRPVNPFAAVNSPKPAVPEPGSTI